MKNYHEKIELCQWLQGEGLSPDLTLELTSAKSGVLIFNAPDYTTCRENWFSLERVLDLLPKELKIGDHISLLGLWEGRKGYMYDAYNQDDSIHVEAECYHLAALKLLKHVIETYGVEIICN
ncbi:hypothetical protein [Cognatishimia sp.]|uniref:hypothetical protein n=1 Tax=Cognatishimia sp. TaxID=2211648 RepID=UPI003517BD00|nr:hypothetical protein [Cognatishimia sp.]